MEKTKGNFFKKHSHLCWSVLSLAIAMSVWQLISMTEGGGMVFSPPIEVFSRMGDYFMNGKLWEHTSVSLMRVLGGFGIGFILSIPMAFLIGWYKPFRLIVEPWIRFVKSIPPIAYIPLVVAGVGIGESSKILVIFIACFLTSVITIYQGVLNVDETLIKAAKVLGAKDSDMFIKVVVPASLPFIMTAMKLGLSASLTTLVAAEMVGAVGGLGTMIQGASQYFQMDVVLMGIVVIGIMGLVLQSVVEFLEKKLTSWQEKREI